MITSRTGPARRPSYWRPTLAIACSPLDAGQAYVMIADMIDQ